LYFVQKLILLKGKALKNKSLIKWGVMGGVSPRPNYGQLKPTGLKNRVGGLMNYEFLDKALN